MASQFLTKTSRSVGTAATNVGGYSVPAATKAVVTKLTCANITGAPITVTVKHRDAAFVETHIVKDATVPAGSSLTVISEGMKLHLEPGQGVTVTSNTAASVDVVMCVVEMV